MTLVQVLSLCVFLNFRYSSKYSAQIYRAQYVVGSISLSRDHGSPDGGGGLLKRPCVP